MRLFPFITTGTRFLGTFLFLPYFRLIMITTSASRQIPQSTKNDTPNGHKLSGFEHWNREKVMYVTLPLRNWFWSAF